jgi:hypothetical protein
MSTISILSIRAAVEAAILKAEESRAKGAFGEGHWHYLRAIFDEDEPDGFRIGSGCEPSKSFPVSEYFRSGKHPVTFWTCQETYSPSPESAGLIWEECEWSEADYIHPEGDWETYHEWSPAVIGLEPARKLVAFDPKCELDDSEPAAIEEAQKALEKANWKPFKLGEMVDPPYIEEMVAQAVQEISQAWEIQ